jgi:hypothetical protein
METEENIPKLPRPENHRKITIFFDEFTDELYRIGKANGWDTPEMARQAVMEALRTNANILKKPARSA